MAAPRPLVLLYATSQFPSACFPAGRLNIQRSPPSPEAIPLSTLRAELQSNNEATTTLPPPKTGSGDTETPQKRLWRGFGARRTPKPPPSWRASLATDPVPGRGAESSPQSRGRVRHGPGGGAMATGAWRVACCSMPVAGPQAGQKTGSTRWPSFRVGRGRSWAAPQKRGASPASAAQPAFGSAAFPERGFSRGGRRKGAIGSLNPYFRYETKSNFFRAAPQICNRISICHKVTNGPEFTFR